MPGCAMRRVSTGHWTSGRKMESLPCSTAHPLRRSFPSAVAIPSHPHSENLLLSKARPRPIQASAAVRSTKKGMVVRKQ
eukprot:3340587-Rhodomonas_salina.2